jgi:hypothetical protein
VLQVQELLSCLDDDAFSLDVIISSFGKFSIPLHELLHALYSEALQCYCIPVPVLNSRTMLKEAHAASTEMWYSARLLALYAGGVGSTQLSNFLTGHGLKTNLLKDNDNLRHCNR